MRKKKETNNGLDKQWREELRNFSSYNPWRQATRRCNLRFIEDIEVTSDLITRVLGLDEANATRFKAQWEGEQEEIKKQRFEARSLVSHVMAVIRTARDMAGGTNHTGNPIARESKLQSMATLGKQNRGVPRSTKKGVETIGKEVRAKMGDWEAGVDIEAPGLDVQQSAGVARTEKEEEEEVERALERFLSSSSSRKPGMIVGVMTPFLFGSSMVLANAKSITRKFRSLSGYRKLLESTTEEGIMLALSEMNRDLKKSKSAGKWMWVDKKNFDKYFPAQMIPFLDASFLARVSAKYANQVQESVEFQKYKELVPHLPFTAGMTYYMMMKPSQYRRRDQIPKGQKYKEQMLPFFFQAPENTTLMTMLFQYFSEVVVTTIKWDDEMTAKFPRRMSFEQIYIHTARKLTRMGIPLSVQKEAVEGKDKGDEGEDEGEKDSEEYRSETESEED